MYNYLARGEFKVRLTMSDNRYYVKFTLGDAKNKSAKGGGVTGSTKK